MIPRMRLDGSAPPIGMHSVAAHWANDSLKITGYFEAGKSIPILMWPADPSQPWENHCAGSKDTCCLKQMRKYNTELQSSFPSSGCMASLKPMVSGSTQNIKSTKNSFEATFTRHVPWVAMLFFHMSPFFTMEAVQKFSTSAIDSAHGSFIVHNNPCFVAAVPGTGQTICMTCNNILPSNAHFVYTEMWYSTYRCDWECNQNYALSDGFCSVANQVPLRELVGVICIAAVIGVAVCFFARKTNRPHHNHHYKECEEEPLLSKNDVIQFREDIMDLRLKTF